MKRNSVAHIQLRTIVITALASTALGLVGCGQTAQNSSSGASVDNSASGAAAGAAGGAITGSGANGTQAAYKFHAPSNFVASLSEIMTPKASAGNFCPTFKTSGAGCSTSGSSMWLSYAACTFTGNVAWTGTQELSMSSGAAACGTFPNPGANGTLYRQFVSAASSTTPSTAAYVSTRENGTIDDSTANLGNFDQATIASNNPNGGYGAAVSFGSTGARSSISLAHRVFVTGGFDHSVTGQLSVSETAGASTRTLSGSVQVYHNILRVIGTSVFNNVTHSDICCLPVSGSITTTFAAGTNVRPTAAGLLAVGKSETLTFTGCGTATLQNYDGSTASVTLNHCF